MTASLIPLVTPAVCPQEGGRASAPGPPVTEGDGGVRLKAVKTVTEALLELPGPCEPKAAVWLVSGHAVTLS